MLGAEANGQSWYFRQYQVENGLSNNATICSIQDKKGFVWFGTKDGLNRFDGYSFKVFRTEPNNKNSIGSNFIHCLYEDPTGILWVGTENGLYQYDASTEQFVLLQGSVQGPVREVVMDHNGSLWYIIGFSLFSYSKEKVFSFFDVANHFESTSLCCSKDGTIWVSTANGDLKKFNSATKSFETIDVFSKDSRSSIKWIEKLYPAQDGSILIGTSNQGAKIYNPSTKTYHDILKYNSDGTEVFVRNFVQVNTNEIWIGTESGIFIYTFSSGLVVNLKKSYNDPYSLSDNAVYSFCKDREDGIWVTTYFGGVNYHPKLNTLFTKYFPKVGQNSLSGNIIREIKQDAKGNLWIGTEDAGLNKYNIATKTFTSFTPTGKPNSLSYTNIHGLLIKANEIWIGTFEHGLDVMDISSGKVIRHYEAGPANNQLKSNFVFSIVETADKKILLCTTRGAYQYNPTSDDFTPVAGLPLNIWYSSLLQDNQGFIWGATYGNGIYYYNPVTKQSINFRFESTNSNSISSNRINSIFEDADGGIWFATEGGLCKLNGNRTGFIKYTTQQGFPSNFMLSILQDNAKNLWVSTSKGLSRFNPKTFEVKTYTTTNGLLNDQFNFNSAFKDPKGNMYFGSVKGMIRFNPTDFVDDRYLPPVYITGFQVFNKELTIDDQNSPLKQSLLTTKQVTLPYNQSTFSIDFAALSFTAPEMTEYAYQMEGLDVNWTRLKQNRKAYFTDLSPGTYLFKVKAANSSGAWNEKEIKLIIEILSPWWASNLAYAIYIVLALLAIYATISYYNSIVNERNKRRFDLLEIAKEKEIYEAKIDFFTTVAHEIKTPLTLIKAPLEKVIRKSEKNTEISNYLKIMERNTERLIDLTNQLLDFSQTEIQGYRLSFASANISDLLEDAFASFTPLAEQKNLDFKLSMPAEQIHAFVDVDAFNKIIFNLLNNAVKYCEYKVMVQLITNEQKDGLQIRFSNDGYLVPSEMHQKIFEPFVRLKQNEKQKGTGIGLALSISLARLHNGNLELLPSTNGLNNFLLTLPLQQDIAVIKPVQDTKHSINNLP